MVQINFAQRSVNVKIVYYGPGMSGKTTNLEIVHQRAPDANRGELTSISTDGDRTLFFDFMPLDLGTVAGMRTQFQLYTVPGQVYYNSTRKLVLQGVDGVIFIADSSASMLQENADSLRNLQENLLEYGKSLDTIPWVIQYNKRDLPDALSIEELQRALNPQGVPCYEAVANTGQGVFPTLKALAARVLETIHSNSGAAGRQDSTARAPAAAPVGQQAAGMGAGSHPQSAMPRGAPEPQHAGHAVPFGAPSMVAAAAGQSGPFAASTAGPASTVPYGFPQPSQGFDAVASGQAAAGTQVRAAIPMPAASAPAPAPALDSTALRLRSTQQPVNAPARNSNTGSGGGGSHGTRATAPASRSGAPPPNGGQSAGRRAPSNSAAASATATAPAPSTRLKPRAPQPTPKSSTSRPVLVATIFVGLAVIAGVLIAKFVFNIF